MTKGEYHEVEDYLIFDNSKKRFYWGETDCLPWILYAFTEDWRLAKVFETKEIAEKHVARFLEEKCDFDGNSPLEGDRLSVVKVSFKCV